MEKSKLDLITKILFTKQRVFQFLKTEKAYLSFSGGRDSTILSHILRTNFKETYPEKFQDVSEGSILNEVFEIPHVFLNTGVEWANIVHFVRSLSKKIELIEVTPKITFFEIIKKHGYPVISKEISQYIHEAKVTNSKKLLLKRLDGEKKGNYVSGKISDVHSAWLREDAPLIGAKCCHYLKKDPVHRYEKETGRRPILAIMADESRLRQQTAKNGCIFEKASGLVCNPMIFWTHQDIVDYVEMFQPELCDLYTKHGFERTGCVGCLYGCSTKKQADEKFKFMRENRPKQYQIYLNNGLQEILNFLEESDKMSKEEKKQIKERMKNERCSD